MGMLLCEVTVIYLGSSSLSNENKMFVLEVLIFTARAMLALQALY